MAGTPDFTAVLPAINFGSSAGHPGVLPQSTRPAACFSRRRSLNTICKSMQRYISANNWDRCNTLLRASEIALPSVLAGSRSLRLWAQSVATSHRNRLCAACHCATRPPARQPVTLPAEAPSPCRPQKPTWWPHKRSYERAQAAKPVAACGFHMHVAPTGPQMHESSRRRGPLALERTGHPICCCAERLPAASLERDLQARGAPRFELQGAAYSVCQGSLLVAAMLCFLSSGFRWYSDLRYRSLLDTGACMACSPQSLLQAMTW